MARARSRTFHPQRHRFPGRAWWAIGLAALCASAAGGRATADDVPAIDIHALPNRPDLPSYGSGLGYSHGNQFWMVTDANPPDLPKRLVRVKINSQEKGEILEELTLTENDVTLTGRMIDLEDVSVAADGTFWSCDESGPWLAHITRGGELTRIATPANLAARANNQGLEGCALGPDGSKLYAVLQSALTTEPDKRNTIVLVYDLATGTFQQHTYRLDRVADYPYATGLTPRFGLSAITPGPDGELYVLERDNLPVAAGGLHKRIYAITVPEQPTGEPLAKRLVLDLVALGYPFEQPEGIAMHSNKLYVVNDGDLSIPPEVWEIGGW